MITNDLINKLSLFESNLEVVLKDTGLYRTEVGSVYLDDNKVIIAVPYYVYIF